MFPEVVFCFAADHGWCAAIRIPSSDDAVEALADASLLAQERTFAQSLPQIRRRTWVAGRAAMRLAAQGGGWELPAVLTDDRGAPMMPTGLAGSISHKDCIAVGLVSDAAAGTIGVDIEIDRAPASDIASQVLAADETAALQLEGAAGWRSEDWGREVLLRFSVKEAIYKALDPYVRRYVAFREVSVFPRADGSARVVTHLPANEGAFYVDVRWRRADGWVLTTARVRLAPMRDRSGACTD